MIDVEERKCLIEQIDVLKNENKTYAKNNNSLKEQLRYKLQKNIQLLGDIGIYFMENFTKPSFNAKTVIRWIDEYNQRNVNIFKLNEMISKNNHKIKINKESIEMLEDYLKYGDDKFEHKN